MTPGQQRAVRELERVNIANPGGFDFEILRETAEGRLVVTVSIRLGPMETRPGGLALREREDFYFIISPDFPFEHPSIEVAHRRFAGFPHVNWSRNICLYQSKVEWNPADGIYGFLDRLKIWLNRAALNDMDPIEGPLHPPFNIPDYNQIPFVIRANCPVEAGGHWFGLAELKKFPNRFELVGWNDLSGPWPDGCLPALAIILPSVLPIEFPENGKDLFAELDKFGIDRDRILKNLRLAAILTPEDQIAYIVLAIPMRRSPEGQIKHHIAVWAIDSDNVNRLRTAVPSNGDCEGIKALKAEMNDLIYSIFELTPIKWCRVMEDRSEIVLRRDIGSPVSWFAGKRVLILGCGALGSWAAEFVARANPSLIHLVDNSQVKPGLIARQNYTLEDIGSCKAEALAKRLRSLTSSGTIQDFNREAHRFLIEKPEQLNNYDVVLDCTASNIFQMKIERDWNVFKQCTPPIISVVIDAKAHSCLCVTLCPNSRCGIWDAYIKLKYRLCLESTHKDIILAFYSERAAGDLFQPEPGCSDLTFSGSTADISSLISSALNLAVSHIISGKIPVGISFSSHAKDGEPGIVDVIMSEVTNRIQIDHYKVCISPRIYREARAWVLQNNRQRSQRHETGGLLWGLWDDAVGAIWIFDASGPPSDCIHDPGHFVCGVNGTVEEHDNRLKQSMGTCGFIGYWHTHPNMPSQQSLIDIHGMATLVSHIGLNQKRALMLIFGRSIGLSKAGIYIYESQSLVETTELISIGVGQVELEIPVV
jgi:integrative and conjugative element protein (TIGR02256 family)